MSKESTELAKKIVEQAGVRAPEYGGNWIAADADNLELMVADALDKSWQQGFADCEMGQRLQKMAKS